jgi:hypothetical protein
MNGSRNFFPKYLTAVVKSPPNAQTKHHDIHDPSEWVDVPYEHSETPRSNPSESTHRIEEQKIEYPTPVEKK